ncbi:MAG TPA: hypothetical protein VK249_33710, partial [Anaerolineales bacterium]|nr:hypothetical protein [Anaerolineales bacterium]
ELFALNTENVSRVHTKPGPGNLQFLPVRRKLSTPQKAGNSAEPKTGQATICPVESYQAVEFSGQFG